MKNMLKEMKEREREGKKKQHAEKNLDTIPTHPHQFTGSE